MLSCSGCIIWRNFLHCDEPAAVSAGQNLLCVGNHAQRRMLRKLVFLHRINKSTFEIKIPGGNTQRRMPSYAVSIKTNIISRYIFKLTGCLACSLFNVASPIPAIQRRLQCHSRFRLQPNASCIVESKQSNSILTAIF